MNKLIKTKMNLALKSIGDSILKDTKTTADIKLEQMDTVVNLAKIVENYDDLEPVLKQFFAEKARRDKFNGQSR